MTTLRNIRRDLRRAVTPGKAAFLPRFFKTGPGEYGEGDVFLGVIVPDIRAVARRYRDLGRADITALLASKFHEERLLALVILVDQFERAGAAARTAIFDLYLSSTDRINNWDLVDLSAPQIIGGYLRGRSPAPLFRLAKSPRLWERRIAIVATHYFIKRGRFDATLRIAAQLLDDDHDLIHKAVGWMLREVGKRSPEVERAFLDAHAARMPRTMLRYAIEKFPKTLRKKYLSRR